jgi:hypothetical protein
MTWRLPGTRGPAYFNQLQQGSVVWGKAHPRDFGKCTPNPEQLRNTRGWRNQIPLNDPISAVRCSSYSSVTNLSEGTEVRPVEYSESQAGT